ncbi:MAG: gliding motility lipoprotein GldH [Tenacibaculum sp.]|nr:gliding motility lipoprotein GldH [Tenacibaculum sp.]
MKKIININKIIFFVLITFVSCDSKRIFDEYKDISNGSWSKDEIILFQFDINDTIAKRNLLINLRNNNEYPFSNLFLITDLTFPDGNKIIDTLEYEMTDKIGRFLGKGFSEIKENKLLYKENIIFPAKGNYTLSVRHAMRKSGEVSGIEFLNGITEIGFRIEKNNNNDR